MIELLSVVAAISLLLALLIPTGNIVRKSAKRAKTRVMFTQWSLALQQFKQEYGYFPKLYLASADPAVAYDVGSNNSIFYELVSGLDKAGFRIGDLSASAAGHEAAQQNVRSISFYNFSSSEVRRNSGGEVTSVIDPFGNSQVWIVFDLDGDGRILASDFQAITSPLAVTAAEVTSETVFASVAIYSAGAGGNPADVIRSWSER